MSERLGVGDSLHFLPGPQSKTGAVEMEEMAFEILMAPVEGEPSEKGSPVPHCFFTADYKWRNLGMEEEPFLVAVSSLPGQF